MNGRPTSPRYNQPIPDMRARTSCRRWLGCLTALLFATFSALPLFASSFEDTAHQLARKIAVASGPGTFALEVTNHSSLNERSVRDISSAIESQLQLENIRIVKVQPSTGTITVALSESLRDYVWAAEIVVGSGPKKVALISLPRPAGTSLAPALPVILKSALFFAQPDLILDFAQAETPTGPRLLLLDASTVAIYRRPANTAGQWELEATLPIPHLRPFPRDLRGRILLRRDHPFDIYLPGQFCRSNSLSPLTLACSESDDPWPLASDDTTVRAFFAASRNFFTGTLSPGIGKISNVPSFYSAAAIPRSGYSLWALAALDGSLHLIDGTTDQAMNGYRWGSDLAAVHSSCGVGAQLLASASGAPDHDTLRAFEIPDHEPVAVSAPLDFNGQIVALWPDANASGAAAIVRRQDTGWYEAYRIYVSCSN